MYFLNMLKIKYEYIYFFKFINLFIDDYFYD
jgi:hypothetical protein